MSRESSVYIDLPVGQIVRALSSEGEPGSKNHQEVKGALSTVLTERLVQAIDRHEHASTTLGKRVYWLNFMIGVLTLVGVVFTGVEVYLALASTPSAVTQIPVVG
jgi:hypothetical protein